LYPNRQRASGAKASLVMAPTLTDDRLLTTQEVAEFCGVSLRTIKNWIAQHRFPVIRLSGCTRIRKSELEKYLRANTERAIGF
jgi:excisionase family DNA binding protein